MNNKELETMVTNDIKRHRALTRDGVKKGNPRIPFGKETLPKAGTEESIPRPASCRNLRKSVGLNFQETSLGLKLN